MGTDLAMLTSEEMIRLKRLEQTIKNTKAHALECAVALAEICEAKLYRAEFRSFEAYCRAKWDWSREYAYRLLQTAKPKALPGKRSKKGRKAAAPPPPAPDTSKPRDVELDKLGRVIPEEILPGWHRAEEFQELLSQLSLVKVAVEDGLKSEDPIFVEVQNTTLAEIKAVIGDLRRVLPYAVCTTCHGHKPDRCKLCKRRGWISKFLYDTAVAKELKK